ncbi:cytochrome c-type biogenesis protein CcmI [Idiomarina aquatica]|jgi:cytochrome c-type biogenesis protein CcmI|uniref:Cytochrome c-type biogenesis protein CcmI n=1 Tax=Idiomarina aquatica TaxID=1327752 RepID=A0A4R6P251_9GAMM|nr:c-type cytochrome biogenesis protein CcmI [Idiomarina aquatica]TDP31276.1 cytochrome c-type biogenesis protein CcmI [Idiomarina aquatica]
MIKLVLALAVLVILAVIVILLARVFQHKQQLSRDNENQQWYRQRLSELDEDHANGRVSEEEYQQAVTELDKTFVTDNRNIEADIKWLPAKPWLPIALLVVMSVGLYMAFGSWTLQRQADDALQQLPELGKTVLQEQQQVDAETLSTFALGLRQKLQRQGDDPIAWWIYAGLMSDLQQFDQANNAFQRSLDLDPDRVGTLISYARFLLQNGSAETNQQAAQLLARALRLEPDNADALSLSGFVAFENADYEQAINAWQRLLSLTPADSNRREVVEQAIADAKQQLQQGAMSLTVTVELGETVRDAVPANGTLFIYVTAPDGAPMPAAVKRVAASSLPVTVTLSNQDSMLPDYQLSSLEQWKVQARVSQDDKIDVQVGDLNAVPVAINAKDSASVTLRLTERVATTDNQNGSGK